MYTMIGGATAAIAVRNERRKNPKKEKNHMEKLGRPNRLLLNPNGAAASPAHLTPAGSLGPSRTPSRNGSFDAVVAHTKWSPPDEDTSYGDECCDGRISLLHFCVVFLLAGITILIVGAVQFKEEAELFKFRQLIVSIGFSVLGTGFLLFFIKCVCFCRPRGPSSHACVEEATNLQISRKSSLDHKNGLPVVIATDETGLSEQEMVQMESKSIYVNEKDGLKPLDQTELENSEQIIRAEVEICYSELNNP